MGLRDLLMVVVNKLFVRAASSGSGTDAPKHLLQQGYTWASSGYGKSSRLDNAGLRDNPALKSVFPNALVSALREPPWERLHNRIGDALLVHLLSNCVVLQPLPNKCFLQVVFRLRHRAARWH